MSEPDSFSAPSRNKKSLENSTNLTPELVLLEELFQDPLFVGEEVLGPGFPATRSAVGEFAPGAAFGGFGGILVLDVPEAQQGSGIDPILVLGGDPFELIGGQIGHFLLEAEGGRSRPPGHSAASGLIPLALALSLALTLTRRDECLEVGLAAPALAISASLPRAVAITGFLTGTRATAFSGARRVAEPLTKLLHLRGIDHLELAGINPRQLLGEVGVELQG